MRPPAEDYKGFPKVPRLLRDITITEKIDGINGLVYITLAPPVVDEGTTIVEMADGTRMAVYAGSRRRWLMPGKTTDNYGFAAWVEENAATLAADLGPGRHFGEWWGAGIQRRYGQDHKRFSLFNTRKWLGPVTVPGRVVDLDWDPEETVPVSDTFITPHLDVVPVLYQGPFSPESPLDPYPWDAAIHRLQEEGSAAAPGFMDPEGIMVYHQKADQMFKATLDGDGAKGPERQDRG